MMLRDFVSQREKQKYFRSLNEEQKVNALNEMIEDAEHIVFLGGGRCIDGERDTGFSEQEWTLSPKGRTLQPLQAGVSLKLRLPGQEAGGVFRLLPAKS